MSSSPHIQTPSRTSDVLCSNEVTTGAAPIKLRVIPGKDDPRFISYAGDAHMNRYVLQIGIWSLALVGEIFVPTAITRGDDPTHAQVTPKIIQRARDLTDAVLAHHIEPPARQQMYLSGLVAAYEAAELPVPVGLGRRVSELTTSEQFAALVAEHWAQLAGKATKDAALEDAFTQGLLSAVPGEPQLMEAKDAKVAEQLENNRYVGVQISIMYDDMEKLSVINDVFKGGPADRAGARHGDRILRIDGVDMKGTTLRETVDRLRGELGTQVEADVQQPKEENVRTLRMTRETLPHPTLSGVSKGSSGEWVWSLTTDNSNKVAYISVDEISPSTPHELRALARELETNGFRALLLDLRRPFRGSFHSAVLLADSLLDKGTLGRLRTLDRVETFQAEPDALFRGWPMAVVIDHNTRGPAEWLAAALQDNGRATFFGSQTSGYAMIQTTFPLGETGWSLALATGLLERGNGRRLDLPTKRGVSPDQQEGASETRALATEVYKRSSDVRTPPPPKVDQPLLKATQFLQQSLKGPTTGE